MINDIIALISMQQIILQSIRKNSFLDGYVDEEQGDFLTAFYNYILTDIPNFQEATSQSLVGMENFILQMEETPEWDEDSWNNNNPIGGNND